VRGERPDPEEQARLEKALETEPRPPGEEADQGDKQEDGQESGHGGAPSFGDESIPGQQALPDEGHEAHKTDFLVSFVLFVALW
jgi:hypothetical protein